MELREMPVILRKADHYFFWIVFFLQKHIGYNWKEYK